jgi:ring-1,2-phenylacetyl-CoA epoxidase subunit PaaD
VTPNTDTVREWLQEVKDPEIPVLSILDMGIIRQIDVEANEVTVTITPTFVGCPALDTIKSEIIQTIQNHGITSVTVKVSFKHTWSSNDITERGRLALKKFGLAPPPDKNLLEDIDILEYASCPRCEGKNTELRSFFGATLCRSIHYCFDCKESFEQFKPI